LLANAGRDQAAEKWLNGAAGRTPGRAP
jgi:hypothetical protein